MSDHTAANFLLKGLDGTKSIKMRHQVSNLPGRTESDGL